jgi:uncharacterized membrane protein
MEEQLTVYFGSVADALIVLAVFTLSGAALTNGYSVLKYHHRRSYRFAGRPATWASFATWLVIGVAVVLAIHLIKATVAPNWITLMIAGAIAIIQLMLNSFVVRDVDAAYLPIKQ